MIVSRIFRGRRADCGREVVRARLLFARKLMIQYGVPYQCVWHYAGFSSVRDMEKEWERMF
ncbi:MAG TPA: hypothetical protein IAC03_00400 [Candidatus Coprenecus pullistercoris]|nr:hypothetical protein [Candidatus Coprenecus pullistercoris]